MSTSPSRPDGAAIRREWESLLDEAADACRAARDRVPADQPHPRLGLGRRRLRRRRPGA